MGLVRPQLFTFSRESPSSFMSLSKSFTQGITDIDAPIYRIMPLWAFEHTLRIRSLVLKQPRSWQDPYEDPARLVAVEPIPPKPFKQVMLSEHLAPAFVQCWTQTAASDSLLRAYSQVTIDAQFNRNTTPRTEGVRVRSTPRKLLATLEDWCRTRDDWTAFIGGVSYAPAEQIGTAIANAVWSEGVKAFDDVKDRAALLLRKRDFFAHESEVRLIVVGPDSMRTQQEINVPFDPDAVLEEIAFDPRLVTFEARERAKSAETLGYHGTVHEWDAYQGVLFTAQTECDL